MTTQVINVDVLGDTTIEPAETFTVTLSDPFGATIGRATATGTIIDDDDKKTVPTVPSASISDASVSEGASGGATTILSFTVKLSQASTSTVTLNYATSDGSATAGQDYKANSGTVTFTPGGMVEQVIK